uniref:Uncharacterized protein n=1 Tax=Rhizophora mucronata TaxID=61149 RepID=A0A2P2P921_RHIMU
MSSKHIHILSNMNWSPKTYYNMMTNTTSRYVESLA